MSAIRNTGLVVLALAAILAGCGGDSSSSPPGSPDNPLAARPAPDAAPGTRSNEAQPAPGHREAETPGYKDLVERQTAKPRSRFTPCNLVSLARARAILGAPLQQPVEAPQGPTCIYRTRDGDGFITIAVQSLRFDKLKRQMRRPQPVDVSSRTAYCGKLGQPVLYLPLSDGRVLSVAAPCRVARQFAAAAVRRLDA